MPKARVVEIIPSADNVPPQENILGYTYVAETLMEKKVPVADPITKVMPPPIMLQINGKRYYLIGYTWEINVGAEDNPPESMYVIIVQPVPDVSRSGLVKADASTMDRIKQAIPAPGTKQ